MDKETAKYIVVYFSNLLTSEERLAIRHTTSILKLESADKSSNLYTLTNVYKKRGWLTDNQNALDLLKDGYDNFEIRTAKRILNQHKDKVFLNYCPKCKQLARTPEAKQCRYCGYDWHNTES